MSDLAERMHAGVGTPRAMHAHLSSPQVALTAALERALHRRDPISPATASRTNGAPSYSMVSL